MNTGRRLLVVDDEPGILELLKLTFHDFDVETALNVEAAVGQLETKRFDAIITDIRMPGRSGLSLIDHVATTCPDAAVIVITGHQTIDSDSRVTKWIAKPFSVAGIRQTLLDVLNQ